MSPPLIQPPRDDAHHDVTQGYSIEITAKDVEALTAAAPLIPPRTIVAITFLPSEDAQARLDATRAVRLLGFVPMPHFSARRLTSNDDFEGFLKRLVDESGVRRCFVVAGDPPEPAGPFADTASLIATGAFERAGVRTVGLAGHPEGHPHMTGAQCLQVLEEKCAAITARGMKPVIVTQFGFDAEPFLRWIETLRARGIDAPVRLGVPGPAGIKTLMRFAARCGVGASASVLAKYGISITRLIGTAGPDRMLEALSHGLTPAHGEVQLHFYPFGGLEKTVAWIADYQARP
ncbi:methylenetetrahydrofolate reductase [Novosphingobium rosa]|uniref:methylenetetrahydrofolate reductase n=1 Tax=Novosphingobium rosa TaxID=76978 RepID=UPI000830CE17|nr:methylenetetrahydrofolate reductase [Novosphingobium rosa]